MELTGVTMATGDLFTVGAIVVTGLAVVFGIRRAISLISRQRWYIKMIDNFDLNEVGFLAFFALELGALAVLWGVAYSLKIMKTGF